MFFDASFYGGAAAGVFGFILGMIATLHYVRKGDLLAQKQNSPDESDEEMKSLLRRIDDVEDRLKEIRKHL